MTASDDQPGERMESIGVGCRSPRNTGHWRWAYWVIVVVAGVVLLRDLERPFVNLRDWPTAHQAQFGRNHLRYGLTETRGRCVYSKYVHQNPQARRVYPDHPPLLSLTLAASMALFGVSETAVRLVPALCMIASIALTMSLARGFVGARLMPLTGLAMLCLPIVVYFAHTACHEPLTLAFALLALRGYYGWRCPDQFGERPQRDALAFGVGISLAILSGWAGLLYAGAIWLDFAWSVRRRRVSGRSRNWVLVTLPAALAAIVTFVHVLGGLEWKIADLFSLFAFRSAIKDSFARPELFDWILRQGEWAWRNYTTVGLVLATVGAATMIRTRRTKSDQEHRARPSVLPLVVPGVLFILLFPTVSYRHEYWWLHLTPLAALLIMFGIDVARRLSARISKPLSVAAVVALMSTMALETRAARDYFRPANSELCSFIDACALVRERSPDDALVFVNFDPWIYRPYHAGPMQFVRPEYAWYLDRFVSELSTPVQLGDELTRKATYYMHLRSLGPIPRSLATFLSRESELIQSGPAVHVFELRSRQ